MQDQYGNLISSLVEANHKKIVMLVLDGLGDTDNQGKGTSLQIAKTPNLDKLAAKAALGLHHPVMAGITPGSGPGHLGLFGYDPLVYKIGRGVLSALGIDFDLKKGDIAARLNFCTLDDNGAITDRRAGRISTEKNQELVKKIQEDLHVEEVQVFLETESEHRAVLILRGEGLTDEAGDTDPQSTGVEPLDPARSPYEESKTAKIAKDIFGQVRDILQDEQPANMILSRGFAGLPDWTSFGERFKLHPAAVAGYPMYRGIARLMGMTLFSDAKTPGDIIEDAIIAMKDHDFVFAHFKDPDKKGEDGNVEEKVNVIESLDKALPLFEKYEPDALIITGDHSTPAAMSAHSWHPVPLMIKTGNLRGPFESKFDEYTAAKGELGVITAKEIMTLAMAHTGKIQKFGA